MAQTYAYIRSQTSIFRINMDKTKTLKNFREKIGNWLNLIGYDIPDHKSGILVILLIGYSCILKF
jgi:hypothetical protein